MARVRSLTLALYTHIHPHISLATHVPTYLRSFRNSGRNVLSPDWRVRLRVPNLVSLLGIHFLGVLFIRALPFWVYTRAPDYWKLAYLSNKGILQTPPKLEAHTSNPQHKAAANILLARPPKAHWKVWGIYIWLHDSKENLYLAP